MSSCTHGDSGGKIICFACWMSGVRREEKQSDFLVVRHNAQELNKNFEDARLLYNTHRE